MSNLKTYLGDGVYADIDRGMVKLTAEDGIRATNTIYLEPEVLDALTAFVARVRRLRTAAQGGPS